MCVRARSVEIRERVKGMEFPVASSCLHSIVLPGVISELFSQDEVLFGEPLGFDPADV